ncbi:hypothetical protein [Streptomyces sp. NBC_00827]|uniref:hypothetical protein n=1 Tax=Streptomyces sp. NBC_00827 TaxID=2903677 RepID=UPI00386B7B76|nr:hypothetical protein OG569_02235 [Streptomyces sp. NBC_00827]
MSSCTICPRDAPDGHHTCPLHADELRAWLAELPHQTLLLHDFLQPGTTPSAGRIGGTGRATAPVPVDLRVLTLLGPGHPLPPPDPHGDGDGTPVPIRALLYGWADYIASEHPAATRDQHGTTHIWPCDGAHPTHGATITGWCTWLTAYLPYAITRPWIRDFHHQLGDLLAVIRNLTHAVPRRHPQAAPCPNCEAFALTRTDGRWGVTCEACGHHLEPDAYDTHAAAVLADQQHLTTARLIVTHARDPV